jgi:thiol-disulfide isomerase/thioredoxin
MLTRLKTLAIVAGFAATAATTGAVLAGPLKHSWPAPEFIGVEKWLNSDPLTMQQLRGKVVLVDFWTYTCINCINTLPHVKGWHQQYKDQGLVVVGVHTPEFPFERSTSNVKTAIKRFDIRFPVAQDNRYSTWKAYNNQYWPGFYLVDKKGQVVYTHFGEGQYAQTDAAIRALLAQAD